MTDAPAPDIALITGLSGAGRTTAIRVLEDMGWEALDNMPLPLIPRLLDPAVEGALSADRPLALGIHSRTRGFSAEAVTDLVTALRARGDGATTLIFLDAADEALLNRYAETRRRHPMAPAEDPAIGIEREREMLQAVRDRADLVIDTTALSPHDLKAELRTRFIGAGTPGLTVSIQSFAFKRGAPREADMVMDCRFLKNPHWDAALRPRDGRDAAVSAFVATDPLFDTFCAQLADMVLLLLPAYRQEGKAYFSIGLGCTGGRHRSVALAEWLAARLHKEGWRVNVRHRELDRRAADRDSVR